MSSKKITVLVTGSGGQLGQCLKKQSLFSADTIDWIFLNFQDFDLTSRLSMEEAFEEYSPQWIINGAAYTAVDKAEEDQDRAYAVNAIGVSDLAELCEEHSIKLIHVSTDYVFDGDTEISYEEDNFTSPQGVYGASKLQGEELALENNPKTIVVRTSWLYSEFGKNFLTTMLSLFKSKDSLNIVSDQFGQPTNANDLANALISIVLQDKNKYGVFHYSNYPETNWFEFASAIKSMSQSSIVLHPITTDQYPTAAKRPRRSTMALDKIAQTFNLDIKYWEESLQETIQEISENEK